VVDPGDNQRRSGRPPQLEAVVAELFQAQHAVAGLGQLVALGLSARAIQHRAAVGRLRRELRGVYALGGATLTPDGRRMAAVLTSDDGAVLSHRSAAAAWGLMRWRPRAEDVTIPGSQRCPGGVIAHRARRLVPEDRAEVRGIPTTSLHRTLVDLAELLDVHRLERAIHEAAVLRLIDVNTLRTTTERLRGRHGERLLHAALALPPAGDTQSPLEADFLDLCRTHNLPSPRCGVTIRCADRSFIVDALFVAERVVVELDGEHVHGTSRAFHADRRRDAALAAEGFLVVRLTWRRVARAPVGTAEELRRILGARRGAGAV
jgi:very-short-patch-repair endonuclease